MKYIASIPLIVSLIYIVSACGQDSEEIQKSLHIQKVAKTTYTEVPDSVRFHDTISESSHQDHALKPSHSFDFTLPENWTEAPTSAFRQINISFSSEANATCYLTVLPLKGGDVLLNLNRWRGQFELPPLQTLPESESEKIMFLGETSALFNLAGHFKDLGDNGNNFAAICLLQNDKENAYSIKFIGPSEFIAKEKANFISWVASIKKTESEPVTSTTPSENSNSIYWTKPKDWSIAEAKPARLVTFLSKNNLECYITIAGGSALQNINRWRTQMGLSTIETLDQQEKEILKTPLGEAICIFLGGEFSGGMSDKPIENAIMAGALIIRPNNSIFIKMVGNKENILAEKEAFYQLTQSIRDTK